MNRRDQPSARALEYAHDGRWPDDRIDLARLCERYADECIRERDAEIDGLNDRLAQQSIDLASANTIANEAEEEVARLSATLHPWYGPCDALGPDAIVRTERDGILYNEGRAAAIEEAQKAAQGQNAARTTFSDVAAAYLAGRCDAARCEDCNGVGWRQHNQTIASDDGISGVLMFSRFRPCPACGGTGFTGRSDKP